MGWQNIGARHDALLIGLMLVLCGWCIMPCLRSLIGTTMSNIFFSSYFIDYSKGHSCAHDHFY